MEEGDGNILENYSLPITEGSCTKYTESIRWPQKKWWDTWRVQYKKSFLTGYKVITFLPRLLNYTYFLSQGPQRPKQYYIFAFHKFYYLLICGSKPTLFNWHRTGRRGFSVSDRWIKNGNHKREKEKERMMARREGKQELLQRKRYKWKKYEGLEITTLVDGWRNEKVWIRNWKIKKGKKRIE